MSAIYADCPVYHPRFARIVARSGQRKHLSHHRRQLLAGLQGRVVEIGAGAGANFIHYPPAVTEVVAVEPEPHLRNMAKGAAANAPVPIRVIDGLAEALPLETAAFDAAVLCLVLCSVADPAEALREVMRVLRPGGELRYYEHVVAESALLGRCQRLLDRTFWPRAFGGCRTAIDTSSLIAEAGFEIVSERRIRLLEGPLDLPAAARVLGIAQARRSHTTAQRERSPAMAIKVGDRVQTRHELPGSLFGSARVGKGKLGTVYRISAWSGKYSVRFDNGIKRENLTDADVEPKRGWW